jgi:hypothetical protein
MGNIKETPEEKARARFLKICQEIEPKKEAQERSEESQRQGRIGRAAELG